MYQLHLFYFLLHFGFLSASALHASMLVPFTHLLKFRLSFFGFRPSNSADLVGPHNRAESQKSQSVDSSLHVPKRSSAAGFFTFVSNISLVHAVISFSCS